MLMPLLSAKDPAVSAEGTLDPLGLYLIADALGVKLIPGVRERMSHPRFLTLTAVSAALCSEYDDEVLALDGVSAPWRVFEWHVVEGRACTMYQRKKNGTGCFVWCELGSASSPKAEPDAEQDALLASILDKAFKGNCDA